MAYVVMIFQRSWKTRKRSRQRRAGGSANGNSYNLCGTWAGLAVIHGLLQLLIKKEEHFLQTFTTADMGAIHHLFTNKTG